MLECGFSCKEFFIFLYIIMVSMYIIKGWKNFLVCKIEILFYVQKMIVLYLYVYCSGLNWVKINDKLRCGFQLCY